MFDAIRNSVSAIIKTSFMRELRITVNATVNWTRRQLRIVLLRFAGNTYQDMVLHLSVNTCQTSKEYASFLGDIDPQNRFYLRHAMPRHHSFVRSVKISCFSLVYAFRKCFDSRCPKKRSNKRHQDKAIRLSRISIDISFFKIISIFIFGLTNLIRKKAYIYRNRQKNDACSEDVYLIVA